MEKLRFSSLVTWCLPFVGFLRCGIHNLTFGSKLTVPQSASLTAPEVALQPVTQGMPPELTRSTHASLPPLLPPQRKCEPQSQSPHTPKSSSFRNLSSNGVRYKFRERYKPQLQFLKIYAHKNLSRSLAHMMRIYAPPTFALSRISTAKSSPSTETSSRLNGITSDIIIFFPGKRQLCSLKFFGSFFQERTPNSQQPSTASIELSVITRRLAGELFKEA